MLTLEIPHTWDWKVSKWNWCDGQNYQNVFFELLIYHDFYWYSFFYQVTSDSFSSYSCNDNLWPMCIECYYCSIYVRAFRQICFCFIFRNVWVSKQCQMINPVFTSRLNAWGLKPTEVESALKETGEDLNGMLIGTNHICSSFHLRSHFLKMK